jgi:hypothetical protein
MNGKLIVYIITNSIKLSFKLILLLCLLIACLKREEVAFEYYENGNIKSQAEIKNNLQHGITKVYYEEGQLYKVLNFDSGLQVDTMIIYYQNGQIQEISEIKDNLKNGSYREYFEDGSPKAEGWVKNGIPNGIWKINDKGDSEPRFSYFKNGELQSSFEEYGAKDMMFRSIVEEYSILFPKGWTPKDLNESYALFEYKDEKLDYDLLSINVLVNETVGNQETQSIIEENIDEMQNRIDGFNLMEINEINFSEIKGHQLLYSAIYNNIQIMSLQFYLIKKNKLFVVSCISDKANYRKFENEFSDIIRSFSFL